VMEDSNDRQPPKLSPRKSPVIETAAAASGDQADPRTRLRRSPATQEGQPLPEVAARPAL
jgi:hypothetical protein